MRGWHALVALALALAGSASCGAGSTSPPPPGPEPEDLAVLFIGNSLTAWNDIPVTLRLLLENADVGSIVVESVAFPDFGLEDHWRTGPARDRIAAGGWDVVILQQGPSATEGRPSLLEYSQRFADEIELVGARTALYMVWPAQARFFDFDGVSDSYATAAALVGGLLFPAGEAWRAAWAYDADLALYGPDGFHPSLLGSYLAALVMYEQLSGRDPRDLPAVIPTASGNTTLDPATAAVLHQAAAEANEQFALAVGALPLARWTSEALRHE